MRFLTLLIAASILTSCAMTGRSISDVPRIDAEKISVPAMSALPNRDMSITIVDNRQAEFRNQSMELKSEIERATQEALTRTGITVSAISTNALTLTIQDYQTQKMQEGCVKVNGSLVIPKKAKLGSEATGCFEMKTPFGGKMSADITKAYEEALSLVFKNLDEAMGKMQTMKK